MAAADVRSLSAAVFGVMMLFVAGCTSPPLGRATVDLPASAPLTVRRAQPTATEPQPTTTTEPTTAVRSAATSPRSTAASDPVEAMVRRTIDAFNATAGGPVSAQRSELLALLSPGQRSVQRACPVATTTIRFEPVYAWLAVATGWRPAGGTLPGKIYTLPTLIRIYTGDRITGTDLTDLHLAVQGTSAQLPALCTT